VIVDEKGGGTDTLVRVSRHDLQISATDVRGRHATVDGGRYLASDGVPGE
jgi:hypothetical protein